MNELFTIYFFLFGLCIGSFLNVVIYRYNTGKGILGRSQCFSCKRTLSWYDLIPFFSFLFQGARCRTCKSKISWQYPSVELFTGILFAAGYSLLAPIADKVPVIFVLELSYTLTVLGLLVVILVYDLRHKIIPNLFVYSFAVITFIHLFIGISATGKFGFVIPSLVAFAAGPILAFPFYILWLVSGGRWMGLGDAKLALGIGWFLGLSFGGSAIIFGFWIGAIVSVAFLLLAELVRGVEGKKILGLKVQLPRLTMKSEIPFAPFLIAGLLIAFFFRYNIFVNVLIF